MLQLAYYPPEHPTLQRGHCAFCQDFRWLVGFVVPPQYLTIPLFWWPLSSQSTQWHGGATRTMEERDAFGGDLSCPGGAQFFPSRICTCVLLSRISLSLSLSLLGVKVKFGLAPFSFVQYATACDQGQSAETCYAS